MGITKAVILAAGLGSRMQRSDSSVELTAAQAAAARAGLKAMIPIERPFLDYVLSELADAGYCEVCLVIGPAHDQIRRYYSELRTERVRISFAVQHEPLGTADALVAAETFAADDSFVVINSDNYYPRTALVALQNAAGTATVGFERKALVAEGNIAPERVAGFAVMRCDADGFLQQIIEKPPPELIAQLPDPVLVSMNCWRFNRAIFSACRKIDKSPRGEYEIPDAVLYSSKHLGVRYRVIPCAEAVLDLSRQQDIQSVVAQLRGTKVRL